jgi:hypothetical protein
MNRYVDMKIKMGPKCFKGIKDLHDGRNIDEAQIHEICEYIDCRFDCADFRMVSIIRTIYSYPHLLSDKTVERIKNTILNFKYWMDEPGHDSMCYWSENHQILFASIEYLAGQLYPEEIFPNGNMTGKEHLEKATVRILNWLKYRFAYGFTEWHSNTYYEEDITPLSILIDFCRDEEIVLKSKMIMDLLLLDMGMHSFEGLFGATSGRCYEKQKKNPMEQDTLEIGEYIWGFGNVKEFNYERISSNFILMKNYDLPEVLELIGRDQREVVIKDSMGLDLKEIKREFSDLEDIDTTGMFLWAMESFTNPESINMAVRVFNEWKLQKNNFLKDFKKLSNPLLRKSGLLPLLIKLLNPVTQGIAIQRANTYTYKTEHYMLSTVQNHHPGEFGDQQHVWQATLSPEVTVFTTHPGAPAFDDINRNFSPDYWVGTGIFPHSVQDKNVHLSIYNLKQRKGFMERNRVSYTHAFFPQDKFDEVLLKENYIFGKLGGVYIVLIGRNPLSINRSDSSDIIQEGLETFWICEIGTSRKYGSFEGFIKAINSKEVNFFENTLLYKGDKNYKLTYKGEFEVDGKVMNTEYDRLDTPYVKAERKPRELKIEFEGRKLYLNFEKGERIHE